MFVENTHLNGKTSLHHLSISRTGNRIHTGGQLYESKRALQLRNEHKKHVVVQDVKIKDNLGITTDEAGELMKDQDLFCGL